MLNLLLSPFVERYTIFGGSFKFNKLAIQNIRNNKAKEENIMGLFDINDEKLQALYHRALVEANYGFVNPRKYSYLDRAIMQYARENGCSYDQALILAKTGNKMF